MTDLIQQAIAANLNSLNLAMPEIILTLGILVIVTVDLIVSGDKKSLMTGLTVVTLVAALVSIVQLYDQPPQSLFVGMLSLDPFSLFFKLLVVVTTLVVVAFGLQSSDICLLYTSDAADE